MKKALALISLAILGGCASTPPEPLVGPNGRALHVLRCNNTEGCFAQASMMCPAGYDVVGLNNERRGSGLSIGGVFGSFGRGGGVGIGVGSGGYDSQSITVECR